MIGLISGAVLGFTGGGGAVVSVPLFIYLVGAPIKHATTLGLFTVLIGSVFNGAAQYRKVDLKFAVILAGISFISSKIFAEIKPKTPPEVIKAIFIIICAGVLWNLWKKKKTSSRQKKQDLSFYFMFTLMGFLVGASATMAGLSGGLILVPFLVSAAGIPLNRAVATSLATMGIASIGSIFFQFETVAQIATLQDILLLTAGSVGAAIALIFIIKKVKPETQDFIRKWLFTVILGAATIGVALS